MAIEKIESILDDKVLPTIGTNEPMADLIERFKTESEATDKKFCSVIVKENNVIKIPIVHFINFFICCSAIVRFMYEERLFIKAKDKYITVSGMRRCLDTVSIITEIKETDVEKTAPEKEFADITQRLKTMGIAADENTLVESTQFFMLLTHSSIGPILSIINATENDEYNVFLNAKSPILNFFIIEYAKIKPHTEKNNLIDFLKDIEKALKILKITVFKSICLYTS